MGDVDFRALKSAIDENFKDAPFSYDFYELGSKKISSYQYPATATNKFGTILGAKISGGSAFKYGNSIKQGTNELATYLTQASATCPETKFILAGYSQGAQVVSSALPVLHSKQVLYSATFGDPKLYLPEGIPVQGHIPACFDENFSDYRTNVPDCRVSEGILGGTVPYQPTTFQSKLGAWCNYADFMCGSIFNFRDLFASHLSYASDASYTEFAKIAYEKALSAYRPETPSTRPTDLALVLDSTERMSFILQNYTIDLLRLSRETLTAGGQVSVFDYCDDFSSEPYLRSLALTDDYLTAATTLARSHQCYGTENAEASALHALHDNLRLLTWRNETNRAILLLTDSPFYDPDSDGSTTSSIITLAKSLGVHISIITTPDLAPSYYRLADETGGQVSASLDTDLSAHTATLAADHLAPAPGTFRFSLTPDTAYSPYTFVTIDDAPLGLTDQLDLEFTDLSPGAKITLTRILASGARSEPLILTHDPSVPTGLGSITSSKHILPKAPNSGA